MRQSKVKALQMFECLNSFFDNIYIISLQRSRNRHELLLKQLEGLEYEFFWGDEGERLDLKQLQDNNLYSEELAKKKSSSNIPLTRGEIGCSLSHVEIYKDMLNKDYEKVLIFEDDIKVDVKAADSISKAFEELPDDWEFLYLGYLERADGITFKGRVMINFLIPLVNLFKRNKYDPERLRRKFYKPFSENLEVSGKHSGTHAYGITKEGAKKLLEFQTPVIQAPDNAVGEMCMDGTLNAYRLKTQAFYQNRELPTTIKGRYQ